MQVDNNFFDKCPQLEGYEDYGSEPSLKALILRYYSPLFEFEKAEELTQRYITQLIKE